MERRELDAKNDAVAMVTSSLHSDLDQAADIGSEIITKGSPHTVRVLVVLLAMLTSSLEAVATASGVSKQEVFTEIAETLATLDAEFD